MDAIACVSVNDAFVMGAWGDQQKAGDKVDDAGRRQWRFHPCAGPRNGRARKFGMGKRSQRFSMVVENGVVKQLNVEEPGSFSVSSAEHVLNQL